MTAIKSDAVWPSPTTIKPGQRLHHWRLIAIDGRRVTALCRCGQMRIVVMDDLISGLRTSCGCQRPPKRFEEALREHRMKRRVPDWRPGGRGS